jgi:hypothetical protein
MNEAAISSAVLCEAVHYGIATKLHLSTMAAVGAVCMSKVANELAGGRIPEGTTFEDLSERLFKEVTMAQ